MLTRYNLFRKSLSLIQYVSDIHLEKGLSRNIIPRNPYLVLAGDIGYPNQESYKNFLLDMSNYFKKVFIVAGNHEYDIVKPSEIHRVDEQIENICSMRNNLFFLQKKSHVICKENNLLISGCTLWSKLPAIKYKYHLDQVKWLKNTLEDNPENNYIVATHHCPLFENLYIKNHGTIPNYFATDQSELLKMENVLLWIHGHNHLNRDINIHGKWIMSNQYGGYEKPLRGYK